MLPEPPEAPAHRPGSRYLRDVGWSLAGRASMILGMFLINVMLARLLTREDFGRFVVCFSVISVLGLLSPLGANNMAVRAVTRTVTAGRQDEVWPMIVTILGAALVGGAILVALMIGPGAGFMYRLISAEQPAPLLLAATALWTAGYGFQLSVAEVLRAAGRICAASFAGGAVSHLAFVGLLAAFWAAGNPIVLDQVLMIEAGIVAAASLPFLPVLRAAYRAYPLRWSGLGAFAFLRDSFPAAMLAVLLLLMTQVDVLALGLFRPDMVGIYGAASRLVLMLTVPSVVLEGALAPRLAVMQIEKDRIGLQELSREAAGLATVAAGVMLVLFLVGGARLTAGIFGPVYGASAPFLVVLAFGYMAAPICGSALLLFILAGRQRLALALLALCAAAFSACVLAAARFASAEAVAATVSCGLWATLLVLCLAARRVLGVWTAATPAAMAAALRHNSILWRHGRESYSDIDRA